ncbi:hypothetical protein K461DRAFT_279834 [Myriangium duriaei CBS 260.36]|uniref:PHD-type domain-containing protein n=1 Tax=Myriangium duriaei CBS 260.36 TaxID=1168546 RepID=A0A9P4MKS1_9PEZI|nr:hypothetical protein K461DRAFT_279834 [Myriangium duriaei CBS 260.36]
MPPTAAVRKTQAAAATDQNRRSSGRQIRASISRPTNYYARPFGSIGGPSADEVQDDSPPGFFPAITYFTDAVAALPKEVMRHFTLMKEVEAKIYGPTQEMALIADRVGKLPLPPRKTYQPSRQALLSFTANNSTAGNSANASMVNGTLPGAIPPSVAEAAEQAADVSPIDQQMEMQRRQEFFNLRMVITQVLANLDEKNVCLAEANRTLDKQLGRMDSVMPHVEAEISEEARLGSLTHWAYADNRKKNTTQQGPERSRRDVAATSSLAAAAAAIHEGDIAAARNEGRKETKKSRAQQHVDSEMEERVSSRKTQQKSRKAADTSDSKGGNTTPATAPTQPPKKRKVEKTGGVTMERTASTTAKSVKAPASTQRSTPAAEPAKKKAKPPVPPMTKKRNPTTGSPAQSPRMAASPTMASFALANETPAQRPSSRMRQTSSILQHSTLAREASPPKASDRKANGENRTNGLDSQGSAKPTTDQDTEDVPMVDINDTNEKIPTKEEAVVENLRDQILPSGSQDIAVTSDGDSLPMSRTRSNGVRSTEPSRHAQKSAAAQIGDEEGKHARSGSNSHILKQIASFNRSPVLGRRELPGTEDDSSASDSRPASRAKRPGRTSRRQESRARSPVKEELPPVPPLEVDGDIEEDEGGEDHDPDDPDEPKYCYCGRGSYGTMIGCENENCEREWFHLECTGLRAVPSENVKWYCDDCDPKARKKSKSGRH